MATYRATRDSLVGGLLMDAAAHEVGRFDDIGRRFDVIDEGCPGGVNPALTKLRVALAFWDAWIEARDRRWEGESPIAKGEWPMLARRLASDLVEERGISETRVTAWFDPATSRTRART